MLTRYDLLKAVSTAVSESMRTSVPTFERMYEVAVDAVLEALSTDDRIELDSDLCIYDTNQGLITIPDWLHMLKGDTNAARTEAPQ